MVYGKTGGDNALHFFRYVNDLLFEQCDAPFSQNCTDSIMENNNVGTHFVDRCMNHSRGVEADDWNSYLEEQIQQKGDFTIDTVPALEIGETVYSGEHSTAAIFRAVCAAYPAGNQPMACEFCQGCSNVRYCLWFLQCDGTSFDMYAAEKLKLGYVPVLGTDEGPPVSEQDAGNASSSGVSVSSIPNNNDDNNNNSFEANSTSGPMATPLPSEGPVETPPPTAGLTPPVKTSAPTPVPPNDESLNNAAIPPDAHKGDEDGAQEALIHGVLIGLAIGFVVSVMYGCRDWQARLILREISLEEGIKASNDVLGGELDGTFGANRSSYFQNSFTPSEDNAEEKDERDLSERSVPGGILT